MELIAHRGASAVAPESTQAALEAAVKAKADMVELDVQMTRDGHLVVFHDERLERTTDGRGYLRERCYRQIKQLDAGGWFAKRYAGQRVLSVAEAFALLPKQVRVNLELKRTRQGKALLEQVLRLLRRLHLEKRVVLSSFESALIRSLARTNFSYALITRRQPCRGLAEAKRLGCVAWHPHNNLVTLPLVRAAHAAGLKVRVWTVDKPARARQLRRWGVDGIFTNNPARLRSIVP